MVNGSDTLTETARPAKPGSKRAKAASGRRDSSDEPPAKKTRVSRACDQCRGTREKCNGAQPKCHTCDTHQRTCTYDEPPKKRGIQPNYIRTLELTLAWLFRNVSGSDDALARNLPVTTNAAYALVAGKDIAGSESLHQEWRGSIVCRQIEQILSGASIETLDHTDGNDDVIASSANDGETAALHLDDQQSSHSIIESIMTDIPVMTPTKMDAIVTVQDTTASPRLALPPNAWDLLEYYLAFTHCWLPVADRQGLLKTMYIYSQDGLSLEETTSGDHAELWAVMALADLQLHQQGQPGQPHILAQTARRLMPDDENVLDLGHARALLITASYHMTESSWLAAWMKVGTAIRINSYLSSHRIEQSIQKVKACAFVLEIAIAGQLGISAIPQDQDMASFGGLGQDGLDEWTPWSDPHAPGDGAAKLPSKANSTFNAIFGRARATIASDVYSERSNLAEIILCVLGNACKDRDRVHPAKLVEQRLQPRLNQDGIDSTAIRKPLQSRLQPQPETFEDTVDEDMPYFDAQNGQLDPFTDKTTDFDSLNFSNLSNAFTSGHSGIVSSKHAPVSAQKPSIADSIGIEPLFNSSELFEQMAVLDDVDPATQHPQFMQNLGFGPDLDLAEFFGPDYQPSDPLLAYMQPSFGILSSNAKSRQGEG